jgi:hypothetical protein
MQRLEEIALEAYLPIYGQDAVEIGGATCLRAPLAPGSPMLNRVVGLGLDGAVAEHDLDDALAAMGETTFYVDVSPTPTRGSTRSWSYGVSTAGWAGCCSSAAEHRGKGGHGALFAARMERALDAGCRTFVTETGEIRDNLPGPSYRNILRLGFEERHVIAHRLRVRQSPVA